MVFNCSQYDLPPLANTEKCVKGPLTAGLVATGLILNCFSLIVLQKLKNRSQIHRYLQGLAVWDNLLLSSGFMVHTLPVLLYGGPTLTGPYVYTFRWTYALSNISLTGTVWMIVILAIDRYIAVVHPFNEFARVEARRSFKVQVLIISVSVLTVLLGIPYAFEVRTGYCSTGGNGSSPVIGTSELRNNWHYQILYRIVSGMFLYSFAPMLLLVILLLRISVEVYKAKQRRQSMSPAPLLATKTKGSRRRKRCNPSSDNFTLLFVAFKFLLTRALTVSLNIAELAIGIEKFNRSQLIGALIDVSNFLVMFNSATNILVYMLVGQRFRTETVRVLCCAEYKRPLQMHNESTLPTTNRTALFYGSFLNTSPQNSASTNDVQRDRRESELVVLLSDQKRKFLRQETAMYLRIPSEPHMRRYSLSASPVICCDKTSLINLGK